MDIKKIKEEIRREMSIWVGQEEEFTQELLTKRANQIFEYMETEKKIKIEPAVKDKIIFSLCNDLLSFGPLQKLMDDKSITEIMVNGPDKVYVEKDGKNSLCSVKFDDETHLRYVI
ncbi:MAG: hypothetical protein HQ570_01095, partial [Candidatus Omnitrophica bacterium]|nr:hypothetical protein [Candidatus Omnitrophota bacterium]